MNLTTITPAQKFWRYYLTLLVAYIVANILWIDKLHTLDPKLKIVVTCTCMLFLAIYTVAATIDTGYKWHESFRFWLFCIILWSMSVNVALGLTLHANPFYLSENTWPDKHLLWLFHNGELLFFSQVLVLILSSGLMNKFKKD